MENSVMFNVSPGYAPASSPAVPAGEEVSSQAQKTAYKIPPALIMLAFLVIGFFGVRWIMEES